MNTKILRKKQHLEKKIERFAIEATDKFKPIDLVYGIGLAVLGSMFLIWIPVLGWIMIPFWLICAPFLGTYYRQTYYTKQLNKLEIELSSLERILLRSSVSKSRF